MKGKEKKIRLLFTGGGTGGHLFPAIATAQKFQQHSDVDVLFIGTRRKLDADSLAHYGFSAKAIISAGVKGKNLLGLIKACCALPVGYIQSLFILRRFAPDIVFGVGGYVTGPVIAAAGTLGIPVVLHEQNAIPGLANRKLGWFAKKVCLSLPGSERFFDGRQTVFTGNPVRDALLQLAEQPPQPQDNRKKTVLIVGGSQGAHALNVLLPQVLAGVEQEFRVIHQCGKKDVAAVRKAYALCRDGGIDAVVESFFTDMAAVYAQADLVISRAGATTLAELAVLGKPAILIPYPYAADDHQTDNGRYYEAGGAAIMFAESSLDKAVLASVITGLLGDAARLQQMSVAMKKLAVPDAAERIVSVCRQVLGYADSANLDGGGDV